MKFLPAVLLAAVGVSAASVTSPASPASTSDCQAEFIVTRCLETTTAKVNDCKPADYACLCAAYEAVVTCYNNCPNDPRGPPTQNQVDSYCRAASALATTSTPSKATTTTTPVGSVSSAAEDNSENTSVDATPTDSSSPGSVNRSSSAVTSTGTNSAAGVAGNVAGVFMVFAGAAAAMI